MKANLAPKDRTRSKISRRAFIVSGTAAAAGAGALVIAVRMHGPLHIAKKLGLPTVSIWGPTDPRNYLKISPGEEGRHLSVYLGKSCSPCVHRNEKLPCGGDNICMKDIDASAVINKIEELLAGVRYRSLHHDPYLTNREYIHY